MEKGLDVLLFSYCILSFSLYLLWLQNWSSLGVVGGLCAVGSPWWYPVLFRSLGEAGAWAGREEEAGAEWPSPCPCPCLTLLFCPQWSQAAPTAEGEQKAHQGESSWLLDGIP